MGIPCILRENKYHIIVKIVTVVDLMYHDQGSFQATDTHTVVTWSDMINLRKPC